jgi:hypothetical protein
MDDGQYATRSCAELHNFGQLCNNTTRRRRNATDITRQPICRQRGIHGSKMVDCYHCVLRRLVAYLHKEEAYYDKDHIFSRRLGSVSWDSSCSNNRGVTSCREMMVTFCFERMPIKSPQRVFVWSDLSSPTAIRCLYYKLILFVATETKQDLPSDNSFNALLCLWFFLACSELLFVNI